MADQSLPGSLQRAVHSSMGDQAYNAIRASIVGRLFKPGQKLVEARLASELGISRGPVRDALKQLVQDGLVVYRPYQGMYVRILTVDDLRCLYDVRVALETAAIRRLCKVGTVPEDLIAIISRMEELTTDGNDDAVSALGLSFHRALCQSAQNPYLLRFFDLISVQVELALAIDANEYFRHSQAEDYVMAHAELLRLIEGKDEFVAALALEEHIRDGEELVLEIASKDETS